MAGSILTFSKNGLDTNVPNSALSINYNEYGTSNRGSVSLNSQFFSYTYPLVFGGNLSANGYNSSTPVYTIVCQSGSIGFQFERGTKPSNFRSDVINFSNSIFGVTGLSYIQGGLFTESFTGASAINKILQNAFVNVHAADKITSIILPSSFKLIEAYAFNNSPKLETVFLSANYDANFSIDSTAFIDISKVSFITMDSEVEAYKRYFSLSFPGVAIKVYGVSSYCRS